jgi:Zn-finger nucleic acid-binding protein
MTSPPRACPSCRRSLRQVDYDGVHVDACDCGGIWFDAGELAAWARANQLRGPLPDANAGAPTDDDPGHCPRCRTASLRSRVLAAARFARCSTCAGIWLTADAVARFQPASGSDAAAGAIGHGLTGFLELLVTLW